MITDVERLEKIEELKQILGWNVELHYNDNNQLDGFIIYESGSRLFSEFCKKDCLDLLSQL